MKKITLLSTIALMLAANTALASKARLIALGEDQSGSFYIEDVRSIFQNVAHVNNQNDFITLEQGSNGGNPFAAGNNLNVDNDNAPLGEGGFIANSGSHVYGIYLGHEINSVSQRRAISTVAAGAAGTGYVAQDRVIDLFFGKDTGIKWGAGFSYSKTEDEATGTGQSQEVLGGRFGVISGNMEYYAIAGLGNESDDGAGNKWEGKLGLEVGAMMHRGDMSYQIRVRKSEFEFDTAGLDPETETMRITLVAGKKKKINDMVTLYMRAGIEQDTTEHTNASQATLSAAAGSGLEDEYLIVPVVVAIEANVKEWLTLRGSVAQNLYGEREVDGKKKTIANTTNVNAGMGLHFGDFTIDGLIGTGNNGTTGAITTSTGAITTSTGEAGVFSTDNLMTRVSMTYKF